MGNLYKNIFYERDKTDEPIFQYAQNRLYIEAMKSVDTDDNSKKILDLGCGIGDLIKYIGILDYYGVDISIPNIRYMSKRYKHSNNIKPKLGDMTNLPYKDNTFDYIACTEVIEHLTIKQLHIVLKEINRVAKRGAEVIITTPNIYYLWAYIPWSFYPLRRRMKIKNLIKGIKKGYVSEEYKLTHYRFRPSFLKKLIGKTFSIEKIETTYWYNNRVIHNISPRFQIWLHKLSWIGRTKLGSQLIFRCRVIK